MTNQIDYQLIDHGIWSTQHFPGCGILFTMFDNAVTGVGDNFAEALNDALELVALQSNIDIENLEAQMKTDENIDQWPTKPRVSSNNDHYYVSIRYNEN